MAVIGAPPMIPPPDPVIRFTGIGRQVGGLALNGPGDIKVRIPIIDGRPDAYQILGVIQQLVNTFSRDPNIRERTVAILKRAGLTDNDVRGQLRTIIEFVKRRLKYVRDPQGAEFIVSPIRLLREIEVSGSAQEDCDGHVLLLNSMLGSVGFTTKVLGVKLYALDRYDHIISSVQTPRGWIDIDPCAKGSVQPQYRDRLMLSSNG